MNAFNRDVYAHLSRTLRSRTNATDCHIVLFELCFIKRKTSPKRTKTGKQTDRRTTRGPTDTHAHSATAQMQTNRET